MKTALLLLTLTMTQTGCAAFNAYKLGHAERRGCRPNDTFQTCDMYKYSREIMARNAEIYQKWDREYVSDDVLVIKITDQKTGTHTNIIGK